MDMNGSVNEGLYEGLNASQRYAATFDRQNLLVLAGAGSGKTKTIIARAKHLIANGADESRIRIVSFTNKSAEEIVSRINTELGELSQGLLKGQTFHSWCVEIVKSNARYFAQADWSIITPREILDCIGYLRESNLSKTSRCPSNEDIIRIYSRAVNTRVSLTQAMRYVMYQKDDEGSEEENTEPIFAEMKSNTAKIISEFIKYKNERRLIDFDDMLEIVAQTMLEDDEAREVISSKIDHILVDEMQDTNKLQYEVLRNFADKCHLFCVGDDAQSIYAFRGADFKSIHNFTEVIPNSEICRLETNYRSTQPILDLSNWLLEQSPLSYNKRLEAARGNGIKPEIINWVESCEADNDIVTRIIKSINQGEHYSDHLVLARANYELNNLQRLCTAKKIPYQVFGGIELMNTAHIADLLSTFRIVSNFRFELPWSHYLKCFPHIGDATAKYVIDSISEAETIEEALDIIKTLESPSKNVELSDVVKPLEAILPYRDLPAKAVEVAFNEMRPILSSKYDNWNNRKDDFPALIELAASSASIDLFVSEYLMNDKILTTKLSEDDSPRDVVTLSTIHSAKGLEASNVYVLNVSNGNYPSPKSATSTDAIEEERRCLYVALTRAKNNLCVYRKLRSKDCRTDNRLISGGYFLANLPNDFVVETTIEKKSAPTPKSDKPSSPRKPLITRFNFN